MKMAVASKAMGISLDLLRRVGGASWLDRYGLRDKVTVALHRSMRSGARVATSAAARFGKTSKQGDSPERLAKPAGGAQFDLTLSEDQLLILQTVQRFAEDVLRKGAIAADEAGEAPAEILAQAHELGLVIAAIPEAYGGAAIERSPVTAVLATEALARGDMGLALAILAPLGAVQPIVDHGTVEQQTRYLPAFAEERFVPAALALLEPHALFDPFDLHTRAKATEYGYVLDGEKAMVPLAGSAELFVVGAHLEGVGPALFLIDGGTPGLTYEAEATMGLRAAGFGRLRLESVHLGKGALLNGTPPTQAYRDVVQRSRIAWAALGVGTCQAILDYVVPYCNDRKAFGEPISHKQAVAFTVADIAIEVEGLRLLTWRAAARAEEGESFEREAVLAKIQCAEKGMQMGSHGVQLLGGHGYVKDHPVELYYRNLRAIGIAEGAISI